MIQIQNVHPGQTIRIPKTDRNGRTYRTTVEVERVDLPEGLRIAIVWGRRITKSSRNPNWTTIGRIRVFTPWRDTTVEVA